MTLNKLFEITENTKHESWKFNIELDKSFLDFFGFTKSLSHQELYYSNFKNNKIVRLVYDGLYKEIFIKLSNEKDELDNEVLTLNQLRNVLNKKNNEGYKSNFLNGSSVIISDINCEVISLTNSDNFGFYIKIK